MGYLVSAEVIETYKAYGKNQKDDKGNILPLGSVKVKLHPNSLIGNVRAHYARPLFTNFRNIPLKGEHILVFELTGYDGTDAPNLDKVLYYFPLPMNATNDPVINQIPHISNRSKVSENKPPPEFVKPGNVFPSRPYTFSFIQPFEGDTTFTGRGGASIRLGVSTGIHFQNNIQPTWKTGKVGNPITILTNKPVGENKTLPNEAKDIPNRKIEDSMSYTIEDAANDFSTTYWTSDQALTRFVSVRKCPSPLSSIPTFNKAQSATNADRIVMQAKKDDMMLIAKKTLYLSASKIRLTTDKHDVDFDDLVDFVQGIWNRLREISMPGGIVVAPGLPSLIAPNILETLALLRFTVSPYWGGGCSPEFPQPPALSSNYNLGTDGLSRTPPSTFKNNIEGTDGKIGGSVTASPDMPGGSESTTNSTGDPSESSSDLSTSPDTDTSNVKEPGTPGGASNTNTGPTPGGGGGATTEPDGTPINIGSDFETPSEISGSGTIFNPEIDIINIPIDFIYPTGKCYGHLYKIVSIIKSKRTQAIVSDVVYLILVIKENCRPGWYIIGSKFKYNTDLEKLLNTSLFILEESMIVEKKTLVNSDCIRKELEVYLYEDNYAHLYHELVDLHKIVEVDFRIY